MLRAGRSNTSSAQRATVFFIEEQAVKAFWRSRKNHRVRRFGYIRLGCVEPPEGVDGVESLWSADLPDTPSPRWRSMPTIRPPPL
jgi:hypothetical protein